MRRDRGRARPAGSAAFNPQHPPDIPGVRELTWIGGGASTTVYRGEEPAMRRKVAIKVSHTLVRDAQSRRSFEAECALAGQAGEHEYAAKLFRHGFTADHPYLVMQYYARGSLADRLKAGQQFAVPEVLNIGVRIACALQFAHDLGILHRDVKPANILCDGFGNSVLADFGIAIARDMATMRLRYTMTPAFAAPEVLAHGGGWPVSDAWSLAATLYTLLAGHPPFAGSLEPGVGGPGSQQALTGPLPPTGRADVPGRVLETLARALIGAPDDRTASARRLAEELNADEAALGLPLTPLRIDPAGPGPGADAGWPTPEAARAGVRADPERPQASLTETGTMDPAARRIAPPPSWAGRGDPQVSQAVQPYAAMETESLSTRQSYRVPATPDDHPRRGPVWALMAIGGALVLAIGATVAFTVLRHGPVAGSPRAQSSGGAARGAASRPSPATAGRPSPPADVRAAALGRSAARIAWTDTAPRGRYPVVVSLGQGYGVREIPDRSPQVITGLRPAKPYCFAVGYVYTLQGKTVYSAPPVCIHGGVPAAGG